MADDVTIGLVRCEAITSRDEILTGWALYTPESVFLDTVISVDDPLATTWDDNVIKLPGELPMSESEFRHYLTASTR